MKVCDKYNAQKLGLHDVWGWGSTLIWGGGIAFHIAHPDLNGSFIPTSEVAFFLVSYDSSAGHS